MMDNLKEILLDEMNFLLFWNEQEDILELHGKGTVSREVFRGLFEKIIDLIAAKNATKLIIDTQKLVTDDLESENWLNNYWLPHLLVKTSVRSKATVRPEFLFNLLSEKRIVRKLMGDIFTDAEFPSWSEAYQWLKMINSKKSIINI
ncbi:MAG: hypothetical protein H7Y04_01385 [Verrucomicrobia bacterium]|nr:hypothetical protein [Cytophagales bacterium]